MPKIKPRAIATQKRLLAQYKSKINDAILGTEESGLMEMIDFPLILSMGTQMIGDIGKDNTDKLLHRLADKIEKLKVEDFDGTQMSTER